MEWWFPITSWDLARIIIQSIGHCPDLRLGTMKRETQRFWWIQLMSIRVAYPSGHINPLSVPLFMVSSLYSLSLLYIQVFNCIFFAFLAINSLFVTSNDKFIASILSATQYRKATVKYRRNTIPQMNHQHQKIFHASISSDKVTI